MLQHIPMAEDEPDIRGIAQLALEAASGFPVKICLSGREALREAPRFAPDLILRDVIMAKRDVPGTPALRAPHKTTKLNHRGTEIFKGRSRLPGF